MKSDDAKQVPGPDAALPSAPAVETIEHRGVVYHLPLADRFRRHTPAERKAMAESVRAIGFQQPVRLYHDTTLDLPNCALDGQGRLETAVVVGGEVPTVHVGRLTTDEAYALALALNDARRHDTPEAIRLRREDRLRRVAAKRDAGMSLRTIAAQENVSEGQVRKDLAKTTGSGAYRYAPEPGDTGPPTPADPPPAATPAPAPKTVVGKDGKLYKARRNTQPRPAPAGGAVDGLGRPVPANLRDVFADVFLAAAADQLSKLAGQIQSASSYASWLPPTVQEVLRKASDDVRDARAFAVHQGCGGRGCDGCMAGGYLPQWMQHDLLEAERGAPPAAGAADSAQPPGVPALAGVFTPRIVAGRPGHQVVLDAFNNPVPAGVGDAFADTSLRDLLTEVTASAELLETAYQGLLKLKSGAKAAAQHPWVELPAAEAQLVACRNAAVRFADLLRAGLPYAVCPRCSGEGCKDCRLSGHWPQHECDKHPTLFRQKKGA